MKDRIPNREIVEVFGPDVKATWLSPWDSGLVTAVRRSLEPLLRNTTTTADDILQPAIIGLGASGEVSRMHLFYGNYHTGSSALTLVSAKRESAGRSLHEARAADSTRPPGAYAPDRKGQGLSPAFDQQPTRADEPRLASRSSRL